MTLVVNFLGLLISGVLQIVTFLQQLPLIMGECLALLPSELSGALVVTFCILLAVRFIELLP